jgi:hypothetical protein
MIYRLPAWAFALDVAFNAALAIGVLWLLRAISDALGWTRSRGRFNPRRRWPVALALTGAGIFGHSLGSRFFTVATPIDAPVPVSVDSSHFDSRMLPALAVRAPPGWSVAYVAKDGRLTVAGPGAVVEFTSTLTEEELTGDLIPPTTAEFFADAGATMSKRPPAAISGLEAQSYRVSDSSGAGDVCLWAVKRGRRFLTTAMCAARGADCSTACAPVLDTLAWRTPAGVAPEDL